jgi:hypothetical protein
MEATEADAVKAQLEELKVKEEEPISTEQYQSV